MSFLQSLRQNNIIENQRKPTLTNKQIYTVTNYLPNKRLSNAKNNQPTIHNTIQEGGNP